jgi:poly-gamma-glutamate capsule biosynthesis protein CapA/YwtB (metallophosphatase superfamily)
VPKVASDTNMNEIKILFTGDFCPQLRVHELIEQKRYDLIFNDFKKEMDGNVLNIVDLECPLTESNQKIHKTGPHLKASPKAVEALKYAGVNVVAMANNHIRDYGQEGLTETIRHCREAGISTVGVGSNLREASTPYYKEIEGQKIAIINITENEWSNTHGEEVGANPLDLVKNFNAIQEAKGQHDVVIVVFHGGNEFSELPSPRLKETFRFFVDAGASAVIAHHTHIVSGYEVYKGAPVFYSLGNFCFDWPGQRNSFWNIGFAVRLKLDKKQGISFDILPFKQNSETAGIHRLSDREKENFDSNLIRLNSIIADDQLLKKKFEVFCDEKKIIYKIYMEPYRNPWLASLYKRGLIPSFFSKQKRRLHLNIMRCESHRDVLLKAMNDD